MHAIYMMETMEAAQVLLEMTEEDSLDVVTFSAEDSVREMLGGIETM